MPDSFTPGKTGFSRVFIIEGRARPDHVPDFQPCLRAGALDYALGDEERIECPDPDQFGEFVEVGSVQGAKERPTTSLVGRYPADKASDLLRIGRRRCKNDVQVNFGACTDPKLNNTFTKKLVFEGAKITNYSTDDLGALESGENVAINETGDISGIDAYEVLQLGFAERAADIVVNPQVDVVICSTPSCGECEDEDDGCEIIYSVAGSTGGSPGTAPDLNYSTDKGDTFASDDIVELDASDTVVAVACIGDYVVVFSDSSDSLVYKLKSVVNAGTPLLWTEVTTGFVAAGSPADAWGVGNYIFICGDGGYLYGTADPTGGVTVLDAGVATTDDLNAIHAISDQFAVAVGDGGTVVFTTTQTVWATTPATPTANNLDAVWVKSEDEWLVGDAAGNLWYTLDRGTTWTQITIGAVTLTAINDIGFSTNSVGYLGGTVAGPAGRILRTYDGGQSWVNLPEGVGAIPAAHDYDAIAACPFDANFVVGVGLADDGADGIIVVGQD
jgi:photosystem II stability/assembly factor-like uncharacterized protein